MEALFTRGPMTVSVDAGPASFAFYHSGVYTEPTCHTKLDELDHAVIVSGLAPPTPPYPTPSPPHHRPLNPNPDPALPQSMENHGLSELATLPKCVQVRHYRRGQGLLAGNFYGSSVRLFLPVSNHAFNVMGRQSLKHNSNL
jgi:hypothetical protein